MAKKKVKFKVTDGLRPKKMLAPGKPFGLRTPVPLNVPRGGSRLLGLGVSCELPVVVVDMSGCHLFAPGEDLKANIVARESAIDLSENEVVAKAFVLDNSDVEVEE